ncbi:isoprenylcysteine carboxyl methyltransferase [Photobacterium jeanii]|uniref:Isoprenylcysteine carboxyl methyltransferase n=1 Tax=Photobacterium jeanii TaxID=858640 RepID=A0A178K302_9GAMM|nr:isoprenylcysteine carboxylmethyltransferase family protein [Photobacterium jeanii]OAN11477.1 isoprenylcysteine carboxyl methyltransferase [Photobacterium jeanii]PST90996.1 isoprenylcysteine carboxylmethyltransferase family protein [Photobacterium jeanii]
MYLKLPPPLLMLITLAAMYGVGQHWPWWHFSFWGKQGVMLLLCALGAFFGLAGVVSFAKARTTINPHKPTNASTLVTSGIYQYSRNPMYLGLVFFLLAAWLYMSVLSPIVMVILFVLYMNHFQIEPEEEMLNLKFGDDYKQYCQQVRRWC